MSGGSSNVSGPSIGSVCGGRRRQNIGYLKNCWCGEKNVALMSKSEHNPYRRYFRCAHAASKKLANDNHYFKWVDEAMLDEIDALQSTNERLEEELKRIVKERMDFEKRVVENVHMKVEKETIDMVEEVLAVEKFNMRKVMIVVVIGCLIMVGFRELVG